MLEQILDNADVDRSIGSNCRILRVHRRTATRLNSGDTLSRFAVIVSDTTGKVVTVLTLNAGRTGSRYRYSN
jgi:hypothetical protein